MKTESAQKVEPAQKAEFAQMMKQHNAEEKHLTIRHFSYLNTTTRHSLT